MKSPMARITLSVCVASSLVGETMRAWTLRKDGKRREMSERFGPGSPSRNLVLVHRTYSLVSVSTFWHTAREIMDVFPVPLCACAMTSLPFMIGTTARC